MNQNKPYNEDHPEIEHTQFDTIVQKAMSRRGFMQGSSMTAMGLFLAANPLAKAVADATPAPLLGFTAVPSSTADTFTVPEGYIAEPMISWGDPLLRGAVAFSPSGKQGSHAQEGQFGDNTDGMSFFPLNDSGDRGLLAVNNEYTNNEFLFEHGGEQPLTKDEVRKSQAAHGVSIFEVRRNAKGFWRYVRLSDYNRRITAYTPMELTGPVAGDDLVKTEADGLGRKVLGTCNNCANGQTPWGTYLTCEENFNGYFSSSDKTLELTEREAHYGLGLNDWGYQWGTQDDRFDLSKQRNEPNRFGWIVEIDPMDPTSTPKKRTAMGRFKHENAAVVIDESGHVVVYMGDDERGEHIYKFVSRGKYDADKGSANSDLLEDGTLYVAVFNDDLSGNNGSGEWVELTYGRNGLNSANGFNSQAEVLVYARAAADVVGATTMDRPEWIAIHPNGQDTYCTLTNNSRRTADDVNGPNPRPANNYGQIVHWWPADGDHTKAAFKWNLFVVAGNPAVHDGGYAGSHNINKDNMFNSPDGLGFDAAGRLWIQTDGNFSNAGDYEGMGNNQMLCGDPSTGEIRRFATGPIGCEITGLSFAPDYRTAFIGIQHPTEHFPTGGNTKPRSTIMAVRRKDGGVIGS